MHNRSNEKLVASFREKSKADKLYDIKFFESEELMDLMRESFTGVTKVPFGHPHFDRVIRMLPRRGVLKILYRLTHRFWRERECERLMFVGYCR